MEKKTKKMTTPTEQNILKGCGKLLQGKNNILSNEPFECNCGNIIKEVLMLCPSCKKLLEIYQLAQKENQSQQNPSTTTEGVKMGMDPQDLPKVVPEKVLPPFADTQLQKYKKETAEKVEELLNWIDIGTSQQGKYFMSLGIGLLKKEIDKIFKEKKC